VQAAPSQLVPPPPAVVTSEGYPISFAPLARRADPAVATVKARVEREASNGRRRAVSEGLGTAFVYDPEGYMLTNNHVIEDATDIVVSFVDGRELRATIVGRDKHTDIAVLRVDDKDLLALPLGDSDQIEVGDWVVAIGNPFGLSHTVSAGILSAKGRTRDDVKGLDPSGYFNFLQTDASINPGNSGGPLLNMKGEVVGINAAVRANANNIGFAIPINMVRQLLPMLLRDGKIRRSQIGLFVDALNIIEAGRLKRPDRKGAWVKSVIAGGPADRAGIAPDDVIIGFDGKTISDPNELRWLASIAGVNKTVSLRIARVERIFDVRVTLGELESLDEPEER
jgi:serine protease Do